MPLESKRPTAVKSMAQNEQQCYLESSEPAALGVDLPSFIAAKAALKDDPSPELYTKQADICLYTQKKESEAFRG